MRAKLAITAVLTAAAFALPGAARADDIILCTGSVDGGAEWCVYESQVPVLNKHPECWPLTSLNDLNPCLNTFKPTAP